MHYNHKCSSKLQSNNSLSKLSILLKDKNKTKNIKANININIKLWNPANFIEIGETAHQLLVKTSAVDQAGCPNLTL